VGNSHSGLCLQWLEWRGVGWGRVYVVVGVQTQAGESSRNPDIRISSTKIAGIPYSHDLFAMPNVELNVPALAQCPKSAAFF